MKKYIIPALLIVLVMLLFVSCGEEKVTSGKCVKCGRETTRTVFGPAALLEKSYGVDVNECEIITDTLYGIDGSKHSGGLYSVYICESCDNSLVVPNPLLDD